MGVIKKHIHKIILCIIACCLIIIGCQSITKASRIKVAKEIDAYINDNWNNYVSTNNDVPYPFTDALEGNILYYWDLYFIQKGLINHGKWNLAKYNLDNQIYQVEKYGYIPNATAEWGHDRSQTPFLSMIIYDYYFSLKKEDRNKEWLQKAYNALLTEYKFWTDTLIENHNTPTGLQRYYHHAEDSILAGVYDAIGEKRFKGYECPQTKRDKLFFGANTIAECESGYDFTPRFQREIINYIPVELNVNLWKYETNFILFEKELNITSNIKWQEKANKRKELINKFCWDEKRGMFLDFNFVKQQHNQIASYATFYPLLWGMATEEQAKRIVDNLKVFETKHGVKFCESIERTINYQWDDNSIWPPVQLVVYRGLENYGYHKEANRIAEKYVKTICKNFKDPYPNSYITQENVKITRESGHLYEKYDINGNILDGADYPSQEMIGWCGGVFSDAIRLLNY